MSVYHLSKPPTNEEVAQLLRSVAAAYEVKGVNPFRIRAYQRAADSIEHASREVYDLWQNQQLHLIPGIGGSLSQHLDELFRTGKCEYWDQAFEGLPEGMFALLPIPGIGPKTAYRLAKGLGLTRYHSAVNKLYKAARQGQIVQLEGFKADGEKRILSGIEAYLGRSHRLLLHKADKIAQEVVDYLAVLPEIVQIDVLGSLRRRNPTVGDIDIAVATAQKQAVLDRFVAFPRAKQVIDRGDQSASILLVSNIRVDLKVQQPTSYGSLLQHFTGSKLHNIKLREYALSQGLSLSEKGIKLLDHQPEKLLQFAQEQEFYAYLKLDWIPPELREGTDEIVVAAAHQLPRLVKLQDIQGDFHLHSSFDTETAHDLGISSMEQMVEQAIKLGYSYLAFSEHNPAKQNHRENEVVEIVKKKLKAVKQLQQLYENQIKIFNSLEIDINPDGSLAVPESVFEYLDFAIVSVHSSFNQSPKQVTNRILSALSHPKAKILGHPTGRLINKRPGYEILWEQLFVFCLQHDKWLEIDGWPDRLDLPDTQVREAVKHGLTLVIGSDAHQVDHMAMMRYGVDTARRGWAEAKSIANTWPLDKLLQRLP